MLHRPFTFNDIINKSSAPSCLCIWLIFLRQMCHWVRDSLSRTQYKWIQSLYDCLKILFKHTIFLEVIQRFFHYTNVVHVSRAITISSGKCQLCSLALCRKGNLHTLHLASVLLVTLYIVIENRTLCIIRNFLFSCIDFNRSFCITVIFHINLCYIIYTLFQT